MEGRFEDGTAVPDGYAEALVRTPWFLRPLFRRRVRTVMRRFTSSRPDGSGGDAGVREPRRPVGPTGSSSAALDPPQV